MTSEYEKVLGENINSFRNILAKVGKYFVRKIFCEKVFCKNFLWKYFLLKFQFNIKEIYAILMFYFLLSHFLCFFLPEKNYSVSDERIFR